MIPADDTDLVSETEADDNGGPLRVNPTRVRRYLRCPYEWRCYAVLGIEPHSRSSSAPRDRGSAMHALLEYTFREYAESGHVFDFAGPDGKQVAREIYEELHQKNGIALDEGEAHELLDAARWHIPRFDLEQWEVVTLPDGRPAVEVDLRGELVPGTQLQAILDLVLRHKKTGKVWFVDWKTTANAIDTAAEPCYVEHDYQLLIGRELLRQHGVQVDFSALVRFRSMAPSPPAMVGVKKQRVSMNRAKLACDWTTFRQALIDNNEDPNSDKAQAIREHLLTAVFMQWRPDISTAETDAALLSELRTIALTMLAISRDEVQATRHLRSEGAWSHGGDCLKCVYANWCTASLRNGGKDDLVQLGVNYRAHHWSPLAGREQYRTRPAKLADAYVDFASRHGYKVEPLQPFKP